MYNINVLIKTFLWLSLQKLTLVHILVYSYMYAHIHLRQRAEGHKKYIPDKIHSKNIKITLTKFKTEGTRL